MFKIPSMRQRPTLLHCGRTPRTKLCHVSRNVPSLLLMPLTYFPAHIRPCAGRVPPWVARGFLPVRFQVHRMCVRLAFPIGDNATASSFSSRAHNRAAGLPLEEYRRLRYDHGMWFTARSSSQSHGLAGSLEARRLMEYPRKTDGTAQMPQ